MTTHSTNLEQKRLVKELFDMVYMWGKVRVVVDETAPAFKAKLREVTRSAKVRESVIDECIEALPVELDWNEYQRRQFSTGTMDSFMYMTAYNQAINDTITNLNALKGKSK